MIGIQEFFLLFFFFCKSKITSELKVKKWKKEKERKRGEKKKNPHIVKHPSGESRKTGGDTKSRMENGNASFPTALGAIFGLSIVWFF